MAISAGDIKIFKSDTMADTIDGGGNITQNQVISGESNSIFDDVSSLDRVFGAVHLRKVYPHVFVQNDDTYLGAHTILTKLPKDTQLGINLFNTDDYHDRRPNAQSRIESYRAKGGVYLGVLYATQWQGSKVVTIFQSEDAPIPDIADVIYLTQLDDSEFQFVKVSTISELVQEFTIDDSTFRKRIVTLGISQPLEYDFVGAQISKNDDVYSQATVLKTVVADAAKYYSARNLLNPVLIGAQTIFADSIYSQVVPSSLQEVAEVSVPAAPNTIGSFDSSNTADVIVTGINIAPGGSGFLGSPCLPGSFVIPTGGGDILDSGGDLVIGGVTIGTINYATGELLYNDLASVFAGVSATFTPATSTIGEASTGLTGISGGNRGNLYTQTFQPVPQAGTVSVSFRSFGEWYDLYDNGAGALIADGDNIGIGTIDYVTGSVILNLSSLPDVDSAIIWRWATMVGYFNRATEITSEAYFPATVVTKAIDTATFAFTWDDGNPKTATVDANGDISGDATGTVHGKTGEVKFTPVLLPPVGTLVSLGFDRGLFGFVETIAPVLDGNGDYTYNIGAADIIPNSVTIKWVVNPSAAITASSQTYYKYRQYNTYLKVELKDDGAGALLRVVDDVVIGSINYTTGDVTFNPDTPVSVPNSTVYYRRWRWWHSATLITQDNALDISNIHHGIALAEPSVTHARLWSYYATAGAPITEVASFTTDVLNIDLVDDIGEPLAEDATRFSLGNYTYSDNGGTLVHSVNPNTGASVDAGTVNITTGKALITEWSGSSTLVRESLATTVIATGRLEVVLRVPNAPVRLESFQIRATTLDDVALTGNADATGLVVGGNISGDINYDTGVIQCRFGELVVAAGNEAEEWYDAGQVDTDGNIFKPVSVDPDTIEYDAVSQTFIPLDAEILGLNPVRLPEDGRVPIFSDGDVVVVLNTVTTSATYTSSTQTDLGRIRIAKLTIEDANGVPISELAYTADLDLGLIDWGDLAGVVQPLTIEHRVEDTRVLTDVQITGELNLSQPLSHDFPTEGTLISNAVLHGNIFAHVNTPFDQQTWSGEWANILIGNDTLAEYNDSIYPIVVDNASGVDERWLIEFISSSTVNVIGEYSGQILSGVSIGGNIAPNNPATGFPYFTIPNEGWGAGWSTGNCLRFNTIAGHIPLWIIQSVAQGDPANTDPDALTFCLEFRGDRDAP